MTQAGPHLEQLCEQVATDWLTGRGPERQPTLTQPSPDSTMEVRRDEHIDEPTGRPVGRR